MAPRKGTLGKVKRMALKQKPWSTRPRKASGADRPLRRLRRGPVDDPMASYLGEISQTEPLTAAEESKLARQIRLGDRQALDR